MRPCHIIYLMFCCLSGVSRLVYADSEVQFKVTDSTGKLISDVVVALYDGNAVATTQPGTAEIMQKDKQFQPALTVVQTGTSIRFPNMDKVRHHVYSFSPAKKFEIKLYSGIPANPVVFDQAGLVTLGCNIHDNMLGYIYIVDTPFFAKSDTNGLALVKVPDADYTYRVWLRGQGKPVIDQKIKISGAVTVKVSLPASISAGL